MTSRLHFQFVVGSYCEAKKKKAVLARAKKYKKYPKNLWSLDVKRSAMMSAFI